MSHDLHHALQHWLPWRMSNEPSQELCEWLYTGGHRFVEPFFDDTISACRKLSGNNHPFKSLSDLQVMEEWAASLDVVNPSAIIFHVSRCGSTLLSQLLSLDEGNIVLSEVPFLDAILRLPFNRPGIDAGKSIALLDAAVKFYGRTADGNNNKLIIKTDSWHLHFYEQLRALYPGVPFILLYRNPREVLLSQERQRGMHAVPGIIEPAIFGFTKKQIEQPNLNLYMTMVLEGYFKQLIKIATQDPMVLLVDYSDGINSILQKVTALPGMDLSPVIYEQLEERSCFHAKNPTLLYKEENLTTATPAYQASVIQLYNELNRLRGTTTYLAQHKFQ